MKTMMNLKGLSAALLASMLIAGPALAMDSAAIDEHRAAMEMNASSFQEHMQMVKEQAAASEMSQVDALALQVQELQKLIIMMLEDMDSQ
ncbi:MAG: hypothetical protein WCD50_16020 [Onishia taeanensis]|uniref:hypothetical protein n=1 Tax=Onishia taeanensis TaxID=284577 RepID=UPI003C7A36E6